MAANVTTASNSYSIAGKWFPYYCKPMYLGTTDNDDAEDGNNYVTQSYGVSDVQIGAYCTSEHNCGFWYDLLFCGIIGYGMVWCVGIT